MKIAIIGAGFSGLATAKVLTALDHDEGSEPDADREPEQAFAHHLTFLVPDLLPVTAWRTP